MHRIHFVSSWCHLWNISNGALEFQQFQCERPALTGAQNNSLRSVFLYLSAITIVQMNTEAGEGILLQSDRRRDRLCMRSYHFDFLKHVERIGPTKFRRLYHMPHSCLEKQHALFQLYLLRVVLSSAVKTGRTLIRPRIVLVVSLRLLAGASHLDVLWTHSLSLS